MTAPRPPNRLTYSQWFALLSLKCFAAERAGSIIRHNTLMSLARRGLAERLTSDGAFKITGKGLDAEDRWPA